MKDPNSTVGVITGTGIGGGLGLAFSTFLGLDVNTIAWALIGGVAGEARVARTSWVATLVQFLAVSLLSALTATILWYVFEWKNEWLRHGVAAFFSFYFYPLTQRITIRVGGLADAMLNRAMVVFGLHPVGKPPKEKDDVDA